MDYEFGADTEKLDTAITYYNNIATSFNNAYEAAKSDIITLTTQLDANGAQSVWAEKLKKVNTELDLMHDALKTNMDNLTTINQYVSDMAKQMQDAINNM